MSQSNKSTEDTSSPTEEEICRKCGNPDCKPPMAYPCIVIKLIREEKRKK